MKPALVFIGVIIFCGCAAKYPVKSKAKVSPNSIIQTPPTADSESLRIRKAKLELLDEKEIIATALEYEREFIRDFPIYFQTITSSRFFSTSDNADDFYCPSVIKTFQGMISDEEGIRQVETIKNECREKQNDELDLQELLKDYKQFKFYNESEGNLKYGPKVRITRPCLSENGKYALIYREFYYNTRWAAGWAFLLRKENKIWKVIGKDRIWMS